MSLVLKSIEDGILTLTVHRPEALNALNRNVIDALSAALEAAQDNPDVRVIVLTGAGEKAFVAGADIKEFADFDQAQGEDLARRGQRDLFDRVFGTLANADDADARAQRLKRSVLDSVVDQYRFYTGPNSPLGAASKGRVKDHLDRIREFEQRAFALPQKNGQSPALPPRSAIPHGGPADPGGEGIDITLEELTTEWRLLADLYALAIEMDRVRFGSLTFLAAGERIRLKGKYEYNGRTRYEFDDAAEHRRSGSGGCSHEWWHKFNPKKENKQLRAHAHLKMREVAYFLSQLDGVQEPNGKSILENSCITISTESGDGRHADVKRELSGVFHAISGANGRFKTGEILDVGKEGIDVYNTMLEACQTEQRLGPDDREYSRVHGILA